MSGIPEKKAKKKAGFFYFADLRNQIQDLKNGQNKFQDKPTEVKSTAPRSNFTSEEREILMKSARSVDTLIKWAETLERCNEGIKCTMCQSVFKFNFENGDDFEENNMPITFRHLKYDLCRHLNSMTYKENLQMATEISL